MAIQEHLAPYLNRFDLLFKQNATAKMVLSCDKGNVSVNILHDFGVVVQTAQPAKQPDKQPYSEILKKNVKPSQLKRLQKRASTRAEEASKLSQNHQLQII